MKNLVCIVCPNGCRLTVTEGENIEVSGAKCPRGKAYAVSEMTNPTTSSPGIGTGTIPAMIRLPPHVKMTDSAPLVSLTFTGEVGSRSVATLAIRCGSGIARLASRTKERTFGRASVSAFLLKGQSFILATLPVGAGISPRSLSGLDMRGRVLRHASRMRG